MFSGGSKGNCNFNKSLNFAFWNIRGFNSKIIGKKVISQDFLREIQDYDIIGLAETHVYTAVINDLAIPGYKLINYINCERNPKSHTSPGGLALFCKEKISKYIIPLKSDNKDVIWTKIKKDVTGQDKEIYLGTLYFSPSGNKESVQKKYQALAEDISNFQTRGYVILQGDFNARTNNCQDTIEYDEVFIELEGDLCKKVNPRNSEDRQKLDLRGEQLIELCKTLNINIINGRKAGDIFGKITSFQWNGKAVVDYIISSSDLLPSITSMRVGNYNPFISDHCPLFIRLNTNNIAVAPVKGTLFERPIHFRFRETDRVKLIETLKNQEFSDKLNFCHCVSEENAENLATEITDILIDATKASGIKLKQGNSNHNAPWFDNDCQSLYKSIKRKCKQLKHMVDNNLLNLDIMNENKKLKTLVKMKKNAYKCGILENMVINKKDQKLFWKLLDKIQNNSDDIIKNNISGHKWQKHFKSVLQCKTNILKYPPNSEEPGTLDYDITVEELLKASFILKCNKATGYDSLSNEMIKSLLETNPEILLKLFNCILNKNPTINKWMTSILTPIYKSGDKAEPSNYRGISIMSCLYKFFNSILNLRLTQYALENKILKDTQLGFRKGNRTTDAHIILHSLIQKYCYENNQKLYGCFVDFKKAFDTIPRALLFEKLLSHGVKGKFFNVLKNMYSNDSVCIKIENKITDSFRVNQGVKQGCVLSPLLFNIFLSDLPDKLVTPECRPAKFIHSKPLGCIAWADDILLLSETNEGLQNMLSKLIEYSSENHMEINSKKTEGMIFNKTGKFIRTAYKLNDDRIYTTNSYKYLGFLMTPSGVISHGLSDLKDRAIRAYYKLKQKLGYLFRQNVNMTLFLYNSLVRPILLYASDFWGCIKMPLNNPIETAHMRFCKDLLGVQKQTTNIGVLLELGEVPLTVLAQNNCIKNYSRITIRKQANEVLTNLSQNIFCNQSWFSITKHTLDSTGIEQTDSIICKYILGRLSDVFHQKAHVDINRENSKLRTYSKIKTKLGMEQYLTFPIKVKERISLTKLRLSNHTLMIETGRHLKLELPQRCCPFCTNVIETEQHFILDCKTYSNIREEHFHEILHIFPIFNNSSDIDKFVTLMSNEIYAQQMASFIHKAFEIRSFMINNPKNHE